MPLYEYKCRSCDETFEVIQKFSDAPLKVHEKCGGAVDRLVSAPSLRFKGSGWYVTDYAGKSNGQSQSARDDKKDSSSSSSDSKTKSESKPSGSAGSEKSSGSDKGASSEKSSSSDKKV